MYEAQFGIFRAVRGRVLKNNHFCGGEEWGMVISETTQLHNNYYKMQHYSEQEPRVSFYLHHAPNTKTIYKYLERGTCVEICNEK